MEGGGPAGDVWPFIILTDDSCVMWNAVDLDARKYIQAHYLFEKKFQAKLQLLVLVVVVN